MSSPRPIAPVPTGTSPHLADPGASLNVGTPPPVPQIPPRGSLSSGAPRSIPNQSRATSANDPAGRRLSKPSTESLNHKTKFASSSPNQTKASFLNNGGSSNPSGALDLAGVSGQSTPRATNGEGSEYTEEEKAKVLRRHLVSAEERSSRQSPVEPEIGGSGSNSDLGPGPGPASRGPSPAHAEGSNGNGYGATDESSHFPLPFNAPGGDVTHELYKWQQDNARARLARSASFSGVDVDRVTSLGDPTLAHIKEPGGFRRNFVVNRAQEQGLEPPPVMRNVIDFLFYYGHFAGEDLEEDDDDDDEDEDTLAVNEAEAGNYPRDASVGERAPLLRGRSKSRHRRTKSGPPTGSATVSQAVLMLLKGFVGTGILFMARAFLSGGILFSTIVMLGIAAISLWSFLLLTSTYIVVPGSFGDIGGELYGNGMRLAILASIAISQIGFVTAYIIFIAQNLQAFILAVTDCKTFVATRWLIFSELIVFLPLAMIRNITKLSGTALVADAFILIGLVYIGANEISTLVKHGVAPDVVLFNSQSFPLLIGTAVFAFEGIGLVIPITESMREPHKFPKILSGVMFVVAVLFAGFGFLGYAAYGSDINTVVIVNLPQDQVFVQVVQCLYSIAILLSIPLQLFPAVRIMENGLFSRSGKHNTSVKWQKNLFRAGTVVCCSLISWAGSKELDKFVSLVGSFACIPLCFIYPPLLHLKAVAKTRTARFLDYGLLIFGICVGIFTTVQTLRSLFEPSGAPAQFGKCKVPEDS
ncbi:transmembrane amino acid transporter protein-domain-containing protein [Kockovaella imperatae]|uniref:Transmembrane amino acid transporter protein-domain-containing protein n=1 Tax=Kockovaella imperatae TaxID=4999 RepID=A0A1Y1USU2_9TREE|nr:transmembrane amino acid transporter protein-domain-containing protein [Kockovaella imperatae]ORX40275.1 transmembrane amino acid transporter protein-domain-containing protein [Kockovaella imperatae]